MTIGQAEILSSEPRAEFVQLCLPSAPAFRQRCIEQVEEDIGDEEDIGGPRMNPRFRRSLIVAAVVPLAVGGMMLGAGKAFAYGAADQPIAQVEISGNCDNPSYPLCANEVGLGGVWVWSELDTSGSDLTSGTMDATVAFCGHVIGSGGPGSAGGGGGPDRGGTWYTIPSIEQAPLGAFPFYDMSTYTGSLRVLDFFPGSPDDFIALVPAQLGHYSLHPINGVSIQTQIAP